LRIDRVLPFGTDRNAYTRAIPGQLQNCYWS